MPIRKGDGTGIAPKGLAEVRKGDGTVLWSAADPAYFAITITGTNSPVVGGETLDVDYTVTNTGDVSDTRTVDLIGIYDVNRDQNDHTIGGGNSVSDTLSWDTGGSQNAGSGDIEVQSPDDSESASVTVQEPAYFDVSIDSTNSPITSGETLDVDYTVENTGDVSAIKDVELLDFGGSVVDTNSHNTGGGVVGSGTLNWNTSESDDGSGDVTVQSPDDSTTTNVTIEEAGPSDPIQRYSADSSTHSYSGGDPISSLDNLGSDGQIDSVDAGSAPTFIDQIGGVIDFSGGANYLHGGSQYIVDSPPLTVYTVAQFNNTAENIILDANEYNSAEDGFRVGMSGSGNYFIWSGSNLQSSWSAATNSMEGACFILDGSDSHIYAEGSHESGDPGFDSIGEGVVLGAHHSLDSNGDIGVQEVRIYDSHHDASDRQTIETELDNIWGMGSFLP